MKSPTRSPAELLAPGRALTFANVAEGAEGLVVSDLARAVAARQRPPAVSLAVVCRDGPRMQQLARALEFFAPDLPVMQFPAWDCQPYDRVSPHGGILAQRLTTLARLSRLQGSDKPLIVLTTVNAIVQRVPAREIVAAQALSVAPGHVQTYQAHEDAGGNMNCLIGSSTTLQGSHPAETGTGVNFSVWGVQAQFDYLIVID